ncbi:conserved Plasmodium protein, unknown function [Plasmodium berghei]|uniref:Thioredoxin-like protein n=2 Tax=Plasmodium berghei TaxID=5821 RepID=A0A509AVE5_PLABA|nr:conserved Plasmodium protein, unknown function [Plasmodium berghei ANKA]CXJ25168.1 conserved Plasmodium protein, unknown function [Plasmodium berghei]SCM26847.1 conserved Plasmodium protein, unknown function [Plasmodium berghei]SCN28666.1 conserved Plasmodium protein, unknown function [Plasmodium berghei]SCO62887.1 conserved Plasmodium protein, unknown function [Plasmodium berghei]SCO64414.1 conserved Plasmodium protein, unknown function [Plasmodium berghei]|eukprot:XP_034424311.1 conserved Plasmodium protein, unknown function [Plasmodium berghei ANKA]
MGLQKFKNNLLIIRNTIKCRHKKRYGFWGSHNICSNNTDKNNLKLQINGKNEINLLKILTNKNITSNNVTTNSDIVNTIENFRIFEKKNSLEFDRIIYKPDNYEELKEFVKGIEKNEKIINDYEIYYYEENISNIKLNRNQEKNEIFINIEDILKDKKISSYEKKNFLEKKKINNLYYYNIQRYEENSDPSSLLIDKRRLTKSEYRYQYISTILPYICFAFMLFFPHFLICLYIPYIKEKNKKHREICKVIQIKQNIHLYKDIKTDNITSILDNNIKTIVLFYNSKLFLNKYIKSLMIDLSRIFKNNSIPINIVGIDTSIQNIPYNVIKDINHNHYPLLYFILPYHYDNDSAVLKIENPFALENILFQIKDFVYIPETVIQQVKELSIRTKLLKKCIFEHEILGNKKEDILYEYGSELAHFSCLQYNNKLIF